MREIPCLFFFPYYPIRPHLYSLILPSVVGRCPSGYGLVCRCSRTSGRGHAEYYPAFLAAFAGKTTNLPRREARAVLALAPTPADTARLTKARIAAALRRAGRRRGVEDLAAKLHTALRAPHLRQPPLVERAMGVQALALLTALNPAVAGADQLAEATADAFSQHPDHAIITSFPGLADTGGARVLAETGDDRSRFTDPPALKAYAGSAPVTRASGRSIVITRRRIKNDRLATAGWTWAFASLTHSPGARAHYDRRRMAGDRHAAALRHLFNRFLGQLHHCLTTGQHHTEAIAFPPHP